MQKNSKLILIIKTELLQLLTDKKLLTSIIVLIMLHLIFIFSIIHLEKEPIQVEKTIIFSGQDSIFMIKHNLLLLFFCIISFGIPALIASDITAGEKERKTLELLLLTNCSRHIILWGKYCVVLIFSLFPFLISSIFTLSLTIHFSHRIPPEMLLLIFLMFPYITTMSLFLLYNGLKSSTIRSAKSQEQKMLLAIPVICIVLSWITDLISILIFYIVVGLIFSIIFIKTKDYLFSEKILM